MNAPDPHFRDKKDRMPHVNHGRLARRFSRPETFLDGLDVPTAAELVAASADLVLLLDEKGVVRDLAIAAEDLQGQGCERWLGLPWMDTVTVESRAKIEEMLAEALHLRGPGRWRHINHPVEGAADLPLAYSVVPFATRADGKIRSQRALVALGRDLRAQATLQQRLVSAQASMERDYWRLRHIETRYRLLFQTISEPVLVLDAATGRLLEANPAAQRFFSEDIQRAQWNFVEHLKPASTSVVQDMLAKLRATGRADPVDVLLRDHHETLVLSGSLFRHENESQLLLRLTPKALSAGALSINDEPLNEVVERQPDAFVLTDYEGRVMAANRAFVDMTQLPNEESLRGLLLDRWLGRGSVDLNVLLSNLRQRGVLRLYATRVRSEYGAMAEVEISAVALPDQHTPCMGFAVRDVGLRLTGEPPASARDLPRSADQMTELVGRVPLRDIVRETTDLIEQLCIEAALRLTGDNRVSAAEMLGLSRQSLYVKLRRFGMTDSADPADPDASS